MSSSITGLCAAIALGAAIALPAAAQELHWLAPEAVLELPGATGDDGITRRPLLRHEDAVIAARASLPPDSEVPPHPHPAGKVALVTVLSGEIELALGDEYDAGRLQTVPAGSLIVFRADDPQHFARTGPNGAELLIVAGPAEAIAPAVLGAE